MAKIRYSCYVLIPGVSPGAYQSYGGYCAYVRMCVREACAGFQMRFSIVCPVCTYVRMSAWCGVLGVLGML